MSRIRALHQNVYVETLGASLYPSHQYKMYQVIEQKYLDKPTFFALLTTLFPDGDFSVEVSVRSGQE